MRFSNLFFLLALVLVAVGGKFGWDLIQGYPVETVRIQSGFKQVSQSDISELVAPFIQSSLVTTDTEQIRAVIERNEWVDWVRVNRQWPNALHIEVYEHEPIASYNQSSSNNQNSLVSRRGKRFSPAVLPTDWQSLPRLSGPDDQLDSVLDMYRRIARIIQPMLLKESGNFDDDGRSGLSITQLTLNDYQGWMLELEGQTQIRVDRDNSIVKLKRLVDYHQLGQVPLQDIEAIDLRYPHGLAVQWRESSNDVLAYYVH